MVDVSDFSDQFRQLAKAGFKAGQIPIGLYSVLAEVSEPSDKTLPVRSRSGRASVLLSYSSEDSAKRGFREEAEGLERDITVIQFSSEEMQKWIEVGMRDVRGIAGLPRIDVKGTTWVEKNVSKDRPCYIIGLVNTTVPVGGTNREYTLVYCCGYLRVKASVIALDYYLPLKDEKSVELGRKELQAWFELVEKANQGSK
jgi:hypothetical protein